MRFRLVCGLTIGCVLAALCPAQQLDTVIYLPDSMGYCYYPDAILSNPVTGRVYVLNGSVDAGVPVFDPATRTKDRYFRGQFYDALYCPGIDKVYLGGDYEMLAVDAANDRPLRALDVDFYVGEMAYCRTGHKLYVVDGEMALYVLDADADTVTGYVELEDDAVWLAWDDVLNRIIIGENSAVEILDCATDSIVEEVSPSGWVQSYAYDPLDRKLYGATDMGTVEVVSVDSLEVVAELSFECGSMAYNSTLNRIYCSGVDTVAVIDCTADTVRAFVPVAEAADVVASTSSGEVYVVSGSPSYRISVIDSGDTVRTVIPLTGQVNAGTHSGGRDELYCALSTDRVAVFDCGPDTLAGYMEYPQYVIRGMVYNPAGSKLYLLFPERDTILVLDSDNRVTARIPTALVENDVLPVLNPALNRLYVVDNWALRVIDCNRDEVIAVESLYGFAEAQTAVLVPGMNKLYLFPHNCAVGTWRVWAYDCVRETTSYLPINDEVACAAFHPWSNRLYFTTDNNDSVWVLNPVADTFEGRFWTARFNRQDEMLANSDNGRLYHITHYGGDKVLTIDPRTNTVLDSTLLADDGDTVFWSRSQGKLYICDRSSAGYVKVFDCNLDTVVATLALPCDDVGVLAEASGRLYLAGSGRAVVLDCQTDSVVAQLSGVSFPKFGAYDPAGDRVFFAGRSNSYAVYSDLLGIGERTRNAGRTRFLLLSNPVRQRAVFRCQLPAGEWATLVVFDAAGRRVSCIGAVGTGQPQYLVWPRADARGRAVANGVYFARLESGAGREMAKVILE